VKVAKLLPYQCDIEKEFVAPAAPFLRAVLLLSWVPLRTCDPDFSIRRRPFLSEVFAVSDRLPPFSLRS